MTPNEISNERHRLNKARREYMCLVMEEYDKEYYAKLKVLKDKCSHNYRFSHLGPLGNPWSYCIYCGISKVDDVD